MRKLSIVAWMMAAVVLAGCSGSARTIIGTPGTGTGTGTGATTTLSMGSGTGTSFSPGVIAVSTKSLSAGGSASLQVSIVDQTGALYTTSTVITFSSACQAQGLANIVATAASGTTAASPTVTTTTGTAGATYVATGCSGSDVITATATANGQSLTATATITVASAAIGSLQFVSATPSIIALKGTGSTVVPETSTVIFKLFDTSGGVRAGATVTFALDTSVGGITLAPASAVSDASGQVQTIVSSGSVATPVRVTATTTTTSGTVISTESSALEVSTGIASNNNVSLAVKCQNVEAFNIDGVAVPVTVSMTDRFKNPVADGTTATFRTTLGEIDQTCQTKAGVCSVNWHSQAPFSVANNPTTTKGTPYTNTAANWCSGASPYCTSTTNGRSPILVTAIGEESFVDANGNGIFDSGDKVPFDSKDTDNNFTGAIPAGYSIGKPWQDTQEAFLNQWELYDTAGRPVWLSGEPFIDFNNNQTHDGPDGFFNGLLCGSTDAGHTFSLCSTQTSVEISASNIIVVSGQHANITLLGAEPFTLPTTISMYIYDENYQQMPALTTVGVTFSTGAGTLASPIPAAWPCSAATPVFNADGSLKAAGQLYAFSVTPNTPPAGGTMFVKVTTPLGLVTTFSIALAN